MATIHCEKCNDTGLYGVRISPHGRVSYVAPGPVPEDVGGSISEATCYDCTARFHWRDVPDDDADHHETSTDEAA